MSSWKKTNPLEKFFDSLRMPVTPFVVAVAAIWSVVIGFIYLRKAVPPIDVSIVYYINAFIIYGLWVGPILFFMIRSLSKKQHFPAAAPKTSFICLIPAYNEETVIGNSVKSLLGQCYP